MEPSVATGLATLLLLLANGAQARSEADVTSLLPTATTPVELYVGKLEDVSPPKHEGRVYLKVDAQLDATTYTVAESPVMGMGLYFDRHVGQFTLPQIGVTGKGKVFQSKASGFGIVTGYAFKSREIYDATEQSLTVKLGDLKAFRIAAEPKMCGLAVSFKKVVQARAVLDESFVLKYSCPVRAKGS